MDSVLIVHDQDATIRSVVDAARQFARGAFPDVDDADWRMRPPAPRSVVEADDVYAQLTYTVFEWGV